MELKKSESYQKWIEAGYELFSREGPEGIQVERLARMLKRNKSGFYHYFGEHDVFISRLIEHHVSVGKQYAEEMSLLKDFDPGYINLVVKFKLSTLFQKSLRQEIDNPVFQKTFNIVRKENEKYIIPLWASYLKISGNQDLATELFNIFRDIFFFRVTFDNLNYDHIKVMAESFSKIVNVLLSYKSEIKNIP
jgi:AcrR family transcriptional regulator